MPDPHKNSLTTYYESRISEAKTYLTARYPLVVCDTNEDEVREISKSLANEFVPYEFWKLGFRESTFIVAIPKTFPDTFPKIYLPKKDFEKIYPIPHVDKNGFVCTRDPEVVVINDAKPGEALEQLLYIAVKIVEEGLKKENLSDYAEEFTAYWAERADRPFLSLFTPKDEVMPLIVHTLTEKLFDAWQVIAEPSTLVERWLTPFGVGTERRKELLALYLPSGQLPPSFFEEKKGVLEILKNLKDPTYAQAVEEYFNRVDGPPIIIMSFPVRDEKVLFGWTFPGWKSIRGFRKTVPLQVRLAQTNHKLIIGINLTRMDKERILKRGGTSNLLVGGEVSILLAGCGSLGSYLAMSLARCGISKYLLIDKENLEPENVARHLCGFVDASRKMKKAEAVKKRLQEHFPHIECEAHDGDVLRLLSEEGTRKIETYDLTITAIGNSAIERRINYAARTNRVQRPMIYLWMEPLGAAGQLLFIHPENGGCFDCCFDADGQFAYQVVAKGQTFAKREAGCQSTYLPYASVDVEHFISVASKLILNIITGKETKSKLFTWLGNIEEFTKSGYKISDGYVTDYSYTIIEKEILKSNECRVCQQQQ